MGLIHNYCHSIVSYLKYLITAKSKHGVHSPFVYQLLTEVLANKYNIAIKPIERQRKKLLTNNSIIKKTDFGAGSKNSNNNHTTSVSKLTKTSSISAKYGNLLYQVIEHFKPYTILELGTCVGMGTAYLASVNKESTVYSLEGCKETLDIAAINLQELNLNNTHLILGEFEGQLPLLLDKITNLDFVFFDGNHQYKPTISYFNQCLQKINNNSVFIFDDIHWSPEMEQAWETIKNNDKVTLTIDLFQFGLVFFREEQTKEHFVLKT